MPRGNVRTLIPRSNDRVLTFIGVLQLNGEGMHNACFYLREIVGAHRGTAGNATRREATRHARPASASSFGGAHQAQPAPEWCARESVERGFEISRRPVSPIAIAG